ncbi:uncharacterized protein METZ01_LOCUS143376 [marine metagenome]|uniref:Uncharacterized protein n=1 Tax=marine metagenome TaxID=408172 RepID=A0A381ZNT7_9ZZZZ
MRENNLDDENLSLFFESRGKLNYPIPTEPEKVLEIIHFNLSNISFFNYFVTFTTSNI